jgi:cobalt-zinc-cadmium resistance protein CzcA
VFSVGKSEMDAVVTDSAGKMMNSAVFGQIIILIVYLPILTLQGTKSCNYDWTEGSP